MATGCYQIWAIKSTDAMVILYLFPGAHVHKIFQGIYLWMEFLGHTVLFPVSTHRNTGNTLAFFNKVSQTHPDFLPGKRNEIRHPTKYPFLGYRSITEQD